MKPITKERLRGGQLSAVSHLLKVLRCFTVLASSSLCACHKDAPQSSKPEPVRVTKSPAEIERSVVSSKQALEGLKPVLAALNDKFKDLHRQFDALPPDLPEFSE